MNGCTPTGKPLISILMAVYEPNLDWLRIQLKSLNAQTYPNLRLYIRDDCSPTVPFEEIQSCIQDCISAFPYELQRNEQNLGSNGTFETLTAEAEGDLFAYCDQDDEWLPEKLTVLEEALAQSGALLACSDMYIIDGAGKRTANSITKVRRHHVFRSGTGLAEGLLMHNFVTGCTMLVDAREAKTATPFCPYMVHDHYLALWCAEKGAVLSLPQPLICYRIHGGNQTGLMAGVTDKKSYGEVRIDLLVERYRWLLKNGRWGSELHQALEEHQHWAQARQRNWAGIGGAGTIWKYRCFSPLPSIAELVLKHVPERVFMAVIHLARKSQI
jgi:glycosyltransferase involved in cell wall biosynthesis